MGWDGWDAYSVKEEFKAKKAMLSKENKAKVEEFTALLKTRKDLKDCKISGFVLEIVALLMIRDTTDSKEVSDLMSELEAELNSSCVDCSTVLHMGQTNIELTCKDKRALMSIIKVEVLPEKKKEDVKEIARKMLAEVRH